MAAATPKPKTFLDHLKSLGLGILLLAVGVGLIIFIQLPYFSAWASGGTTWEGKDFSGTPPEETIHFMTVKGLLGGDAGYYEETRLNGIIPIGTDYFGFMLVSDDTLLITKSGDVLPEFEEPLSFTGSLEEFESDVRTQVIEQIRMELPSEMRDMIYPRLFDITENENKVAWIIGGVVCIGMALIGVVMILRGLGGMFSRAARPVERSI